MAETISILLADDEPDIIDPLKEHLFIEGYDVKTAFDGEEAISLMSKSKFDVIILDLYMPKIDGFDVLKAIKKTAPSTKVIILTGHAFPENVKKCKKYGAEIVLPKPSGIKEILDTIQDVIVR
jgi:CheY-like chemotaxis protein